MAILALRVFLFLIIINKNKRLAIGIQTLKSLRESCGKQSGNPFNVVGTSKEHRHVFRTRGLFWIFSSCLSE